MLCSWAPPVLNHFLANAEAMAEAGAVSELKKETEVEAGAEIEFIMDIIRQVTIVIVVFV